MLWIIVSSIWTFQFDESKIAIEWYAIDLNPKNELAEYYKLKMVMWWYSNKLDEQSGVWFLVEKSSKFVEIFFLSEKQPN